MRKTTWAILGSLVINLVLGLGFAAVFSVSPPAQAADLPGCSAHPARARSARPSRAALHRCRAHGMGDVSPADQFSATLSGVAGGRAERNIETAA